MPYKILLLGLIAILCTVPAVYAQDVQLGTYQELVRTITDAQTGNTSASITLQSIDTDEIRLPADIVSRMMDGPEFNSVFVTSKTECVPGVGSQACMIINVDRAPSWAGINAIHEGAKEAVSGFAESANAAFGTDAAFHSIYIHSEADAIRGIANPGTVSVVYSMPVESASLMYERFSGLLADRIRNSGGFYQSALDVSRYGDAVASFAVLQNGENPLMQVIVSRTYTADISDMVAPISLLGAERLEKSRYFEGGSYPLNTLIHAIVTGSPHDVLSAKPRLLETEVRNGVAIPSNFTTAGWVVEQAGNLTDAKYLFGTDDSALASETWFSFSPENVPTDDGAEDLDVRWLLLALVAVPAAGAAVYALKRRR